MRPPNPTPSAHAEYSKVDIVRPVPKDLVRALTQRSGSRRLLFAGLLQFQLAVMIAHARAHAI